MRLARSLELDFVSQNGLYYKSSGNYYVETRLSTTFDAPNDRIGNEDCFSLGEKRELQRKPLSYEVSDDKNGTKQRELEYTIVRGKIECDTKS